MTPPIRQPPAPPARATGARPWWATVPQGEMTQTAEARAQEMTGEARRLRLKVPDRLTD